MAKIDVDIGARRYSLACRDGGEDHLREVAALVDAKARNAAQSLGPMNEARHLLFTSLMLADELHEAHAGVAPLPPPPPPVDHRVAEALEQLAERVEALAERLEERAATS